MNAFRILTIVGLFAVLAMSVFFVGCEQDSGISPSTVETKPQFNGSPISGRVGTQTYQTSVTYPGAGGVNYEYNVTTTVTWDGNGTTFHYSVYATGASQQAISHIFMHGMDDCFVQESGRDLVKEGNSACNADVNGLDGFKWDDLSGYTWEWTVTLPHAYSVEENVGLYVKTARNCEVMMVPGPVCGEYFGVNGTVNEWYCVGTTSTLKTDFTVTATQGVITKQTTTDANGNYFFADIGGVWTISANGQTKQVDVGPESQTADFLTDVRPNGSCAEVTGSALHSICYGNQSHDNVPVIGATVRVGSYTTITDDNGNFVISNVPPGTYTVSIPGYADGSVTVGDVSGSFSAGTFNKDDRPNGSCAEVTGTVTEEVCIDQATTVVPVVGATVTMGSLTATTDANGNFTFENVVVGDYQVSVAGYTVDGAATVTVSVTGVSGNYAAGNFFRVYTGVRCGGDDPTYCSLSMGYWFAKPQAVWPNGTVTIGGHTYTQAEGKAIWNSTNKGGMPGSKLAFQQIAAIKLSGVSLDASVWTLVNQADAKLATYAKLSPTYLPKDSELGQLGGAIGSWIDANHCLETK